MEASRMDSHSSSISAEEDELRAVTFALSKEASLLFQAKKYTDCVQVLNQILLKKPHDPKVLHNIAITEYFCGGCSDPKKLLAELSDVKRRSEDLASASRESAEAGSSKAFPVSKENRTMERQISAASNESIVLAEEFDTSVALLNIAVIWYHLHEYSKALSVLEPLYRNIEAIDETTARRICLLLLDVALASQDAYKSADVLNYLEKAFNIGSSANQGDSGNIAQQQILNPVPNSTSVPSRQDVCSSDLAASVDSSQNSLSRTLSEDYENLLLTLDIGGENLPRSVGHSSSRTSADRSIPITDRLNLQLYKVRFLLLTRSLKTIKREVKEAMNLARGGDSTNALLLKAQFEYARGNYRKSIKLLMASSHQSETAISSICNNNFGCIYYCFRKHHTSNIFFSRALTDSSYHRIDKPRDLLVFSQDKSLLIIYNCGLQYLASGKPFLAARCFLKARCVFYNRPLFWLRIAECCLMALEKGLLKSGGPSLDQSEVRVHVVGKGKWRQLVIEDGVSRSGHLISVERKDGSSDNYKQPHLSVSLAQQCLLNALYLLNSSRYLDCGLPCNSKLEENDSTEAALIKNTNHTDTGSGQVLSNGDVKEQKGGGHIQTDILRASLFEYEQICKKENQMIKQALLANLAFLELESENPLKALSAATYLLELQECSRIYIFLGHVYAAEALCLLNRPKEAAQHLSVYLSRENYMECPYRQDDCEQLKMRNLVDSDEPNGNGILGSVKNPSFWDAKSVMCDNPEEARGMLYVNFAATCAIQGDLEQAQMFATQALSVLPNSSKAILTVVYVDIMLGKVQEALAMLKQCNRVNFLPSNLTLNKSSA